REYSIFHSTVIDLSEQIDLNTLRTLNELTNIKLFDSTIQNGTQIHLHHHHVYHHSTSIPSSEHFYNRLDKQSNGLCIESLKSSSPSSSEQSPVHLTSRQSLQQQQPLFVLNNGYMTGSTQNSTSSNINT
ncbi:unnamed protein product, partial [Rotaria sp. Silwood2]